MLQLVVKKDGGLRDQCLCDEWRNWYTRGQDFGRNLQGCELTQSACRWVRS